MLCTPVRALRAVVALPLVVVLAAPAYAADDTTAPGPVSALTARAGDNAVVLRWTNPADADLAGVEIRQTLGDVAPATPDDGSRAYKGPGISAVADHLTNGSLYAFAVFAFDAAGNYSPGRGILARPEVATPTVLKISRSTGALSYGQGFTLKGWLLDSGDQTGIEGETVQVLAKPAGAALFTSVKSLTTGAGGAVSAVLKPTVNTEYRLEHPISLFSLPSSSTPTSIGVRRAVSARLSTSAIERGQRATIPVTVNPPHVGQRVYLEQQQGATWKAIASYVLPSDGRVQFGVAPTVLGGYSYRVVKPADSQHIANVGPVLRLSVVRRTLREGMSGDDVLELQRRLTWMRYDPAAANGVYNYDTRHAVLAFEKVNGLPRDGVFSPSDWARLNAGTVAPRMRFPVAGRAVEVDITRQVLMMAENGNVTRVIDVSSGNNALYTVDGITSRAVTPRGSFRVLRKINGVRVSRLGTLYRPAYFYGGYAIHGSGSVPGHAASHGCIRITNPAMDRLYALLTVGTPVRIYD